MLYNNKNIKYNYCMLKIKNVIKGGIGDEIGLKRGDKITSFNGGGADILDYIYFDAAEKFTITVENEYGTTNYEIEKNEEELLGLEFDSSAEIKPKCCRNKCIFCFVDQLPQNMRRTLYIKDDDYRLSFITGNYVTLTNVSENDLKRICERKFSPLYISVHATDPEVRGKMLGNKNAAHIISLIKRLSDAGIEMHCQIVLCPSVNDGAVLENTLKELYAFYPRVKSVAVVPVGLTRYRDKLVPVKPLSRQDAVNALSICDRYPQFAYGSDELYLRAGKELPPYGYYGEFEQIENGVGLVRKFEKEFYDALSDGTVLPRKRDVIVVTGKSSYEFIKRLTGDFSKKYNISFISVRCIENRFFGESVTVSGLITGGDIESSLKDCAAGKEIILPRNMLKEKDNVFLDGMEVIELEKRLNADLYVCDPCGYSFFDALIGEL
jgi:putative radical SAM enzyme (TIGR03279 family)